MTGQLALGLKLRDKGVAKVASHNTLWIEKGLAWIEGYRHGEQVTAEEIGSELPAPPTANLMGALFRLAAREGTIAFSHYEKSSRPSRHASVTGVWRRT